MVPRSSCISEGNIYIVQEAWYNEHMTNELNESLLEYSERLESALAAKRPHTTFNSDIFHAHLIILAVFRFAKKEVRLLSHELNDVVYGNPPLLDAVRRFLSKGGKLSILVEQDLRQKHPMLGLLGEAPGKVSIRRVPEEVQKRYSFNFLVMDECGFRFENDREKHAALAGFHDDNAKRLAAVLHNTFDYLSSVSSELKPAV